MAEASTRRTQLHSNSSPTLRRSDSQGSPRAPYSHGIFLTSYARPIKKTPFMGSQACDITSRTSSHPY
eukprot:9476678-Pyramimonas_sp.AAC.3